MVDNQYALIEQSPDQDTLHFLFLHIVSLSIFAYRFITTMKYLISTQE